MVGRGFFLTAFALVALAAPSMVSAQAASTAAAALDEASLRSLAALHVELGVVRDEFNAALATIHEERAQQEARDEHATQAAEILAKHQFTELEYQQKIFAVSTDGALRTLFDQFVRESDPSAITRSF